MLRHTKIGKAAGVSGVVSEMTKDAGDEGVEWLTNLLSNIMAEHCIVTNWINSRISLFKQRERLSPRTWLLPGHQVWLFCP